MVGKIPAPSEYDKQYFTEVYDKGLPYRDFPAHILRAKKLVEITEPKSVLDVGCAYGFIVRHLLNMGIPAMGCDISEWCEKKAKEIIPGHFVRCPTWDLKFADQSFDVIYCEGVLEHVPEAKIAESMRQFARVANKFYLQVSFPHHVGVNEDKGHVCLHDAGWWFDRIPDHSWLFLGTTGTEGGNAWFYKG